MIVPSHAPGSKYLSFALALAAPMLFSAGASAAEACGDLTCADGYTCKTATAPCPDVACPPGAECIAPACEPKVRYYCAPAPCTADSECASGMKCVEYTRTDCADVAPAGAPACPPGAECVPVPPADIAPARDCTTTTESMCTPRWQLPCTADADCGAGFKCEEIERCSSSGSGPTPRDGGGSDGAPPPSDPDAFAPPPDSAEDPAAPTPPTTTCEPSGQFRCVAIETACATDADCPTDWTCRDNPEGVCWADANGESGCTPADPPKVCAPPFSDVPGGVGEDSGEFPVRPETPTDSNGGTPPPTAPTPTPARGESDLDSSSSNASSGGCSVTPTPEPATAFGLLFLGLAAAFGLRRRR